MIKKLENEHDIGVIMESPASKDENMSSDEQVNKYYLENNLQEFDSIFSIFNTCLYVFMISLLVFLFLLILLFVSLKVFALVIIAAFVLVFSGVTCINLSIKMTSILSSKKISFTSFISYVCANAIALCIIAFLVLIIIKYQRNSMAFATLALPLYIGLAAAFLYFLFVLPVFIYGGMWAETGFLLCTLVGITSFILLLSEKIDYQKKAIVSWIEVFIPVSVIFILFFCYSIWSYVKEINGNKQYLKLFSNLFGQVVAYTGLLLFFLLKDRTIKIKPFVAWTFVFFGIALYLGDKLVRPLFESDSNNSSNLGNNSLCRLDSHGREKEENDAELIQGLLIGNSIGSNSISISQANNSASLLNSRATATVSGTASATLNVNK